MYVDTHNSKKFFSALKADYGPSKPGSTPLQSADGSMLIKDQESLMNRWAEHFSTLLNKPSTVDPTALEQVPQLPTLNDLDLPPSKDELSKALKQTNSGRASGKDGIPAEIYKAAGPRAMEVFLDIIQSIWDQEKMPDDFRDALIVALYKNKGSKADCGNYRGISLLSIAGKNLCSYHPEQTHCSFRSQPTRSPIWISPWSQHSGHDIYSETGSGEMP